MTRRILAAAIALAMPFAAPAADATDAPQTNAPPARYVCEGGLCRLVGDDGDDGETPAADAASAAILPSRIAQGYMDADEFLAFLRGEETEPRLPSSTILLLLSLVLAGAALNLTPCVLPLVPVNLIVIGASFRRGLLYGLGIALAYGSLGVLAAAGGVAFGEVQSSPLFNASVAAVFVALGLALCGVLPADLSRLRPRVGASRGGFLFPFAMGALSALLAGACVAPVLVSALVLAAGMFARGDALALAVPFALGVGMALPWPFLGAGLKVLPKPGRWTRWVNRAFALVVFAFAAWYGGLAAKGFARDVRAGGDVRGVRDAGDGRDEGDSDGVIGIDLASPESLESLRELLSPARRGGPVLVDCWAPWCKSCAAMDRGVLRDPRVAEALEGFEVVRLRADDVGALRRLPGFAEVRGLPAFAVFQR